MSLRHLVQKFRSRRGFTLIELMIVIAIVSILLTVVVYYGIIIVAIGMGIPWIMSQTVSNGQVCNHVIESGYEGAYVIEEFRTDPQEEVGCVDADRAGFNVHVEYAGSETGPDNIWLCCQGDFNMKPICREVPSPLSLR